MRAVQLREGGRQVARLVLADIGAGLSRFPFALIYPQDDHERFLLAKLQQAGLQVEWNTRLTGDTQDDSGVQLRACSAPTAAWRPAEPSTCAAAMARAQPGPQPASIWPSKGAPTTTCTTLADVRLASNPADPNELAAHIGASSFALRLPVRSSGMQRLIGIVQGRPASDARPHPLRRHP
jgi:hypothetical protein